MNRRHFILGGAALVLTPLGLNRLLAEPEHSGISGAFKNAAYTEEKWREVLTAEEFHILREEGTEPPGSSPLNHEKREGLYVCAGCALSLFKSDWKYESGTGWPSFYTAIKDHVATRTDFKLFFPRTEYHCARCGGHQGHIFEDGPEPTGLRYCNNGLALDFVPA